MLLRATIYIFNLYFYIKTFCSPSGEGNSWSAYVTVEDLKEFNIKILNGVEGLLEGMFASFIDTLNKKNKEVFNLVSVFTIMFIILIYHWVLAVADMINKKLTCYDSMRRST